MRNVHTRKFPRAQTLLVSSEVVFIPSSLPTLLSLLLILHFIK